jgi:hypothetical protein
MKYFLSTICLLLSIQIFSQDIQKDFVKVYNNYVSKNNLNMDIEMQTFYKNNQKAQITKVQTRKRGNMYYSKLGDKEIMNNGKYTIFINHKLKTLIYDEGKVDNKERSIDNYMEQLQKGLLNVEKSEVIKEKDGIRTYRVLMKYSEEIMITSFDITLNLKRNVIEKIIYYYDENNEYVEAKKAIVTYKNVNFEKPDMSYFKGDKYLNFGKKVTLKSAYKHYKLHAN